MPDPKLNVLVDGQRLDAKVLAQLTSLEVRESDADPTMATLRFKLAQGPTGEFFPLDGDEFGPSRPLAVDVAAPGGLPTRLFSGHVTHVRPHFESIESNCYVEVVGMDAGVLLDAEERAAAYPDASDADAAEQIFGRYGLTTDVEQTPALHEEERQLLVQRATDLDFVSMLARRNGYCFFFEHDPDRDAVVAHFHRPRLEASPQADLTMQQGDENLRWCDFQVAVAVPAQTVGAAIDPILKQVVRSEGEPSAIDQGEKGLADRIAQGLQDAGAPAVRRLLRDPWPSAEAIAAMGTGATDEARFVIEARGELDPALYRGLLRARRPALLKGVGRRLTGAYYVRGVRTLMRDGVLTQTFVAQRNAMGQTGGESFGQQAEEVPPE